MSMQPEHDRPQPESFTPQQVREALLAELETTQQAIAALSDEELITVTGGWSPHEESPPPTPSSASSSSGSSSTFSSGSVEPSRSEPPSPRRTTLLDHSRVLRRTKSAGPVLSDTEIHEYAMRRIRF